MQNQTELQKLRVQELRNLAKENNIKYYYRMNKNTLLEALAQCLQEENKNEGRNKSLNKEKALISEKKFTHEPSKRLIKPIKRTLLADVKIEMNQIFKKLGRNVEKTKKGYRDTYYEEEITYSVFPYKKDDACGCVEIVKIVVQKSDLLKTFEIEKISMEAFRNLYVFLESVIYRCVDKIVETVENVIDYTKNDTESSKDKEKELEHQLIVEEKQEEGDFIELVEMNESSGNNQAGEILTYELPLSENERLQCMQKSRPQTLNKRKPSGILAKLRGKGKDEKRKLD